MNLAAVLVSFGHFLAFFALTAAVVLKLSLVSDSMTADFARRVQRADRAAGMSALLVLVFGTLRVLYFEKGPDYYTDNLFFWLKIGFFLSAALLSIYPTLCFARWGRQLAQGDQFVANPVETGRIKRILHWELILLVGVMLCASLMARGYGL